MLELIGMSNSGFILSTWDVGLNCMCCLHPFHYFMAVKGRWAGLYTVGAFLWSEAEPRPGVYIAPATVAATRRP